MPHPTRRGILLFLDVDSVSLDCAMTDNDARPHLIASYRGMCSAAFYQLVYTDKEHSTARAD